MVETALERSDGPARPSRTLRKDNQRRARRESLRGTLHAPSCRRDRRLTMHSSVRSVDEHGVQHTPGEKPPDRSSVPVVAPDDGARPGGLLGRRTDPAASRPARAAGRARREGARRRASSGQDRVGTSERAVCRGGSRNGRVFDHLPEGTRGSGGTVDRSRAVSTICAGRIPTWSSCRYSSRTSTGSCQRVRPFRCR